MDRKRENVKNDDVKSRKEGRTKARLEGMHSRDDVKMKG
tara:strand:- start:1353 stop:1469 length:117 start_codon:yes stop_codon:yes gene_type:complete